MRILITGVAGFIGSAMAQRMVENGHYVRGIDSFLDSYPVEVKKDRIQYLKKNSKFEFIQSNILDLNLTEAVKDVDYIFHFAAQAGVRSSWGERFDIYTQSNILATQRLLEAVKGGGIRRFVYSSSSSVYGDAETLPTPEQALLRPLSPYAVSKLAGEHMCHLYYENFSVPTVSLRYFTVYGPKPRPDQAVCLFSRAIVEDKEISLFGDGNQLRGMTYVEDVVDANILAAEKECSGMVFNIGGGSSISMNELISKIEKLLGKDAKVSYLNPFKGDARNTQADISKAIKHLGWKPKINLEEGLRKTLQSIVSFYFGGEGITINCDSVIT